MKTRIQKWGHDFALVIPKSFALKYHLSENAKVDVIFNGCDFEIKPLSLKKYSLYGLLRQVKKVIFTGKLTLECLSAEKHYDKKPASKII